MALFHPFKKDRRAFPLSTPPSSRRSMVSCPWLCARRSCFKLLNISCDGCFSHQSTCSVVFLHSNVSRSFRGCMSTFGTFQSGLPIPVFSFCSKLIESVRMMTYVVRLSPLQVIQQRAWVTAHSEHRFAAPSSKLCQI